MMTSETMSDERHLSDLALDRFLAGELDGTPAAESARAHLASCGTCDARRAEILRDAEAFPAQVWIAGEAAKVRRMLEKERGVERRPTRLFASPLAKAVSFAAAASIAAVAILATPPRPDPGYDGIKGPDAPVALSIFAQRATGGRVTQLVPGEALSAGDSVRFQVWTDRAGSLSVLGLDGRGHVSPYATVELPQRIQGEILEGSVVLDDAPSAEVFFAVLCEPGAAPPEAAAKKALEAANGDPRRVTALGSGCHEAAFLVRKKPR